MKEITWYARLGYGMLLLVLFAPVMAITLWQVARNVIFRGKGNVRWY